MCVAPVLLHFSCCCCCYRTAAACCRCYHRTAAAHHKTAADSLARHLEEVDTLKDAIADAERKATTLAADARTRVARIEAANEAEPDVRRVPDADDRALTDFTPPPSGHKDWLAVSLPGL